MKELDGLKPLQIKILMYCLGTDAADIMRPIVNKIKAIIMPWAMKRARVMLLNESLGKDC